MYRVALFGLPTAGKSTLSYLAAKELSALQINLGQILRETSRQDTVKWTGLSRGQAYDDQAVVSIVRSELERAGERGFFLDGFPRNLRQLALFEKLSFSEGCCFVLLDIDPRAVRSRYLRRMVCSCCRRADYGRGADRLCPRCGGALAHRPDASIAALEQKLRNFRQNEEPVIQFLREKGKLFQLAVTGDPDSDLHPLLSLLEGAKQTGESPMSYVPYKDVAPFDWRGLRIRELTPDDLEAASVAEVELPPGSRHETARSTRSDKLYICVEGTVSFRVEGREVRLEPKDLLMIGKNQWFDYQNDSGTIASLLLVHIPPFDLDCEEFRS